MRVGKCSCTIEQNAAACKVKNWKEKGCMVRFLYDAGERQLVNMYFCLLLYGDVRKLINIFYHDISVRNCIIVW